MDAKRAYIVTGPTASLGRALLEKFTNLSGAQCYGLSRGVSSRDTSDNIALKQCDLLDRPTVESVTDDIVLT